MSPAPVVADRDPHNKAEDKLRTTKKIHSLSALAAIDIKAWPWTRYRGTWHKTADIIKADLRRGGDRKSHAAKAKAALRSKSDQQSFVKVIKAWSKDKVNRRPAANPTVTDSSPTPTYLRGPNDETTPVDIPRFKNMPAYLVNVSEEWRRRIDAKDRIQAIGFQDLTVPRRGFYGWKKVKRVDKAGRFCKLHFNAAGKKETGLQTLIIRAQSTDRAPGVWGCAWGHRYAVSWAMESARGPMHAFFEDDLVLKANGSAIDDIVSMLLFKAGEARYQIKICWVGGKDCFGSFKNEDGTKKKGKKGAGAKAEASERTILAELTYGGCTWTLVKTTRMLLAHAYILHESVLRPYHALLTAGWSADGALSHLTSGPKKLLGAAIYKDNVQCSLLWQWSLSKGSLIGGQPN